MRKIAMVAVFAVSLFSSEAMAKEGFYIGAFYPWNSISQDIQGLKKSNAGLGLRAGVGVGEHIALEFSLVETDHDIGNSNQRATFKGGTLDLKLLMPISILKGFEPFVFGGIGKYSIEYPAVTYRSEAHRIYQYTEADGTVHEWETSSLNGHQYGLGADVYILPELSIGAAYGVKKMEFERGTPGNKELRVLVRTVELGVNYHF